MTVEKEWPHPVARIGEAERLARLQRLREAMADAGVDAVLIGSTTNLRYFTGLVWGQSERLCGAVVTQTGFTYIAPAFEKTLIEALPKLPGEIAVWQEDEDPAKLALELAGAGRVVGLDDAMPIFALYQLQALAGGRKLVNAGPLMAPIRLQKSAAEIALIQHVMSLTLGVQSSVRDFLKVGIKSSDVVRFIEEEHRKLTGQGSTFCIVSFGAATALPHGAPYDQTLQAGDAILVDCGTRLDGYHSDLTRTYWLDEPSAEDARLWQVERDAQQAVFDAAQIGATCSNLDDAARRVIVSAGMGPDYRLPGLPHRAGHGLGLDIHEAPYIVRGNQTKLAPGMVFSDEPMIVVPDRLGIRLEDHIYISDTGPVWFTQPAKSPTEPVG